METDFRLVEKLKQEGHYFAAGALAKSLKLSRYFGVHTGMRSTLECSRDQFYAGWDAAAREVA